jgi:hypothetical protein
MRRAGVMARSYLCLRLDCGLLEVRCGSCSSIACCIVSYVDGSGGRRNVLFPGHLDELAVDGLEVYTEKVDVTGVEVGIAMSGCLEHNLVCC